MPEVTEPFTRGGVRSFDDSFCALFEERFSSLYRYLDRLTGDPALAADLAQEAFVRLYGRGSLPDDPGAWLVTVALNLMRNYRSRSKRRGELLAGQSGPLAAGDPPPLPDRALESKEDRDRVRRALDRMQPRERQLLLLRQEGYSYREMAKILELTESSVGTLLRRAGDAFRKSLEGGVHASDR